jgi:hypothetical protein
VVSKKPSKRWQDVETTSPLCVDAKWIWHICNHDWKFLNTIKTCSKDGEVHQEEEFWRFKITWLPCFDVAIFTFSITWSFSCRALNGSDENF